MNKADLLSWLKAEGVRPDAYDLIGVGANEAYVLKSAFEGWEVFYSERGRQTGLKSFMDEAKACQYFRQLVEADPTTRQAASSRNCS